ncbi:unnamed protein product [Orchesella dallaii]|uniref:Pickpocket protein 28 n=1 Tax=Orchesella dallaii TaxID=48710 RepID=A0ABP1PPY8_9HEXA
MTDRTKASLECCPRNRRLDGFIAQRIRESIFHGVKYLVTPNLHYSERIYWIIAVTACFGYAAYLVVDLIVKYNKNPLIISFQSKETQISQIPFPAITICNVNILKGPLIEEIVLEYDRRYAEGMKKNLTEDQLLKEPDFESLLSDYLQLGRFCFQAKSFRRYFEEDIYDANGHPDYLFETNKNLLSLDKENYAVFNEIMDIYNNELGELYKDATHNCEDMILKCMWEDKVLPCQKLFFEIDTRHGHCCVFNMIPKYILGNLQDNDTRTTSEKSRLPKLAIEEWKQFDTRNMILPEDSTINRSYPRHQKAGGKPFGLSILINPELDLYSTCNTNDAVGFKMVPHSPISFPRIMDKGMPIPPSSEVFVEIEPVLTIGNDDLISVDRKKRHCYVKGEMKLRHYKFYSAENCLEECIAEFMYRNCSCIRYEMPRNSSQKLCGAKDGDCITRVRMDAAGKSGRCSYCWPPCTEVRYKLQQTQLPLRENYSSFLYDTHKEKNKTASNFSILHIYFGTDSLYATERNSLYDAAALIANAGGLLGLTLGFSIIALLQLIYFFTLEAWFKYKSMRESDTVTPFKNENKDLLNQPIRMFSVTGTPRPTIESEPEHYNWAQRRTQILRHTGPVNNDISTNNATESKFRRILISKQIPFPYLS